MNSYLGSVLNFNFTWDVLRSVLFNAALVVWDPHVTTVTGNLKRGRVLKRTLN